MLPPPSPGLLSGLDAQMCLSRVLFIPRLASIRWRLPEESVSCLSVHAIALIAGDHYSSFQRVFPARFVPGIRLCRSEPKQMSSIAQECLGCAFILEVVQDWANVVGRVWERCWTS